MVEAVKYARQQGLALSVKGGGHGAVRLAGDAARGLREARAAHACLAPKPAQQVLGLECA